MLSLISALLRDSGEAEANLLRCFAQKHPEQPEWSAAVEPVLTRLLVRNSILRPMVGRVFVMPFNACALPHKTILIAQSLVEFCRNEPGQMAFVVAHEMAHMQLGHSREKLAADATLKLLQTGSSLAGVTSRLLFNRAFSREAEFEADRLAVRFCSQAGYAPEAAIAFLKRLIVADRQSTGVRQLLNTHPSSEARVAELSAVT